MKEASWPIHGGFGPPGFLTGRLLDFWTACHKAKGVSGWLTVGGALYYSKEEAHPIWHKISEQACEVHAAWNGMYLSQKSATAVNEKNKKHPETADQVELYDPACFVRTDRVDRFKQMLNHLGIQGRNCGGRQGLGLHQPQREGVRHHRKCGVG